MTRDFKLREFEAVAKEASRAAANDAMTRFYVPIIGTLECKFKGTQTPQKKNFVAYDTKVVFEWELSSPYVNGSVELAFLFVLVMCLICCCVVAHDHTSTFDACIHSHTVSQ